LHRRPALRPVQRALRQCRRARGARAQPPSRALCPAAQAATRPADAGHRIHVICDSNIMQVLFDSSAMVRRFLRGHVRLPLTSSGPSSPLPRRLPFLPLKSSFRSVRLLVAPTI
jgi:hypothetical protein